MPQLKPNGAEIIQRALDKAGDRLPGCFVTVATPTDILFSGASGKFDVLQSGDGARKASTDDVMWFASTTKLLTSVCYLQLVDRGLLSLDTKMTDLYPPLASAASQILQGFDEQGQPIFEKNDTPITLGMMLNQTSGFGAEFFEKVQSWKKVTDKGKGYVNSCKVENLIHTPICFKPGTNYEYGNSAEWLGLMLPTIAGVEFEEYMQENVLKPLGMDSTTFYPDRKDLEGRVMPLRFGRPESEQPNGNGIGEQKELQVRGEELGDWGKIQWEELDGQMDLLTLPRKREEIEYPVGGGGIYSKTSDYVLILQYLLRHYLSLSDTSISAPETKILSDTSVKSLFSPTLPKAALPTVAEMFNNVRLNVAPGQDEPLQSGDADWTTGMVLFQPKSGKRRGGWGIRPGSVGWGGAAGTSYFIDPATGIAYVFTTQMLPGRNPVINEERLNVEKAVFAALAE